MRATTTGVLLTLVLTLAGCNTGGTTGNSTAKSQETETREVLQQQLDRWVARSTDAIFVPTAALDQPVGYEINKGFLEKNALTEALYNEKDGGACWIYPVSVQLERSGRGPETKLIRFRVKRSNASDPWRVEDAL